MTQKALYFFVLLCAVWGMLAPSSAIGAEVVVYTSLDQVFSEPILKQFEKETGIQVKAVYDVEASKTTGLVNRLIAEKNNPKCDVFWNSEFAQTLLLKQKGVLDSYHSPSAEAIPAQFKDQEGYWTAFSARARVLIVNTKLLKPEETPASIFDLTGPKWRARFAMAYPLFGTTATHVAALYALLGEPKAQEFLRSLQGNGVVIVDGNAVARDVVVEGEVPVAFTDTDDVNVAVQSGKPVRMIFPDKDGIGTLLIPNTAALIKGAPHLKEAKVFLDYVLSPEVESKLAFSEAAQIPVRPGVEKPTQVPDIGSIKVMAVDYAAVAENLPKAIAFCQNLFVR